MIVPLELLTLERAGVLLRCRCRVLRRPEVTREIGVRPDPLNQELGRVPRAVLDQYDSGGGENDDQQESEKFVAEDHEGHEQTEADVAGGPGVCLVAVLGLGLQVKLVDGPAEHTDCEQQNNGVHVIAFQKRDVHDSRCYRLDCIIYYKFIFVNTMTMS